MLIGKRNLNSTKFIALGYCFLIMLGTILLMLPISNNEHIITPVKDALFTATSATCVTGLTLHDTYTYWSSFGQVVILCMIQIGGIGFMTIALSALMLIKRKIGLSQRFTMQESIAAFQVGGIVKMTKFIIIATFIFEGIGAVLLSTVFCPMLGAAKGIYFSIFHAVSAFCNAGMDLMGNFAPNSSFTSLSSNVTVNLVIMALIVIGGLGFFVWADMAQNKQHIHRYRLQSKIVLTTTAVLIIGGAICFYLLERNSIFFAGKNVLDISLISAFQSVTPRTAGFFTVDLSKVTQAGQMLLIILMLIGGSSGSTAGGMKTSTVAVLFLSIISEFKKKDNIECFHRRIPNPAIRHASCILMMYLSLTLISGIFISSYENLPVVTTMFECASAIGTVGLSLGMTSSISGLSHIILIVLMYIGRVGGITILLAFAGRINRIPSQYPEEKINLG